MDKTTTLFELKKLVEVFVNEREWEQFHNPKNLAMALTVEAAELLNIFKWLTIPEAREAMQNDPTRMAAVEEIADVIIYSLAFANRNRIDVTEAVRNKMIKNGKKYPVKHFKGRFH